MDFELRKHDRWRYIVDFKYWGGAGAPILVYLGAESSIDHDVGEIGFMSENAASFKALLLYIEHRYYGESVPSQCMNELGYFDSAQALADYATIISHVKQTLKAEKSPVIVIGGSYGGMLATWFRLKYPHVTIGALASSAPILYFDHLTPEDAYFDVVTKDFKEASESCFQVILNSWNAIDSVASQPYGLSILSNRFNTCFPLETLNELKDYLELMYSTAAQYDRPPDYRVNAICEGINGASFGNDILSKIFGGMVAYHKNANCFVNPDKYLLKPSEGWKWSYQTCTEIVMPIGIGNHSMFQPKPFNFTSFKETCFKNFGVYPRPHWITTYYGGYNIKLVLQKFGSNIIFSNGLRDPYSSAGILSNLSDSLIALSTTNGSHCMDIHLAEESDPKWLIDIRIKEVEIVEGWFRDYYSYSGSPVPKDTTSHAQILSFPFEVLMLLCSICLSQFLHLIC